MSRALGVCMAAKITKARLYISSITIFVRFFFKQILNFYLKKNMYNSIIESVVEYDPIFLATIGFHSKRTASAWRARMS